MVESSSEVGAGGRPTFGRTLRRLNHDRVLYAIMGAYVLFAIVVSTAFGRPHVIAYVETYTSIWWRVAACLGIMIGLHLAWTMIRERPRRPVSFALQTLRELFPPHALAGMALFLATFVFMGAFTTLKTTLPAANAFWADRDLALIDRTLHLGQDPWRLLHPMLGQPFVTQVIEFLYAPVWAAVVTTLLAWMCIFCRDEALRRRYLLAFLLAWIVNGTVLAGVFMSAGPVFVAGMMGKADQFAGLVAYLQQASTGPYSALAEQRTLWATYAAGERGFGAGISAFPSLHVTMATLAILAGWSINRVLGGVLSVFGAVILLGSVHLGWHYAVDGYASILMTLLLWRGAGLIESRLRPAVV